MRNGSRSNPDRSRSKGTTQSFTEDPQSHTEKQPTHYSRLTTHDSQLKYQIPGLPLLPRVARDDRVSGKREAAARLRVRPKRRGCEAILNDHVLKELHRVSQGSTVPIAIGIHRGTAYSLLTAGHSRLTYQTTNCRSACSSTSCTLSFLWTYFLKNSFFESR
jgi:hypothetical protein